MIRTLGIFVFSFLFVCTTPVIGLPVVAQQSPDFLREMQFRAAADKEADWVHWGDDDSVFSNWTNHSNRLIPVYTFGISVKGIAGKNSIYRDATRMESLYGPSPQTSANPNARYFDQTEIYDLQKAAVKSGKKNIILFVCDGLDWQTTQAAAIYKLKKVAYKKGRGKGLSFQDYRGADTEFGYMVTSPYTGGTKHDVNSQTLTQQGTPSGGYNAESGGSYPWTKAPAPGYLLGKSAMSGHTVTDSAASATSMTTGKKTYNASINVGPDGEQLTTIAHELQEKGFAIGLVTSVPISHATPACGYAHNVYRSDYQDITRDLLGVRSIAHRKKSLKGVDVLIGCGASSEKEDDREKQGDNYVPGNLYLPDDVAKTIDLENGGKYVVARRTEGENGTELLKKAAKRAVKEDARLFGFFGGAHLPYATADGDYDPTIGAKDAERYEPAELEEDPELSDMTTAALSVLEKNEKGFWLMVESGDIDWANHNNNIDDAIGSVFAAEKTFDAIVDWVEENSNWDETALIFTADHGHMLVLENKEALTGSMHLGPWVSPKLALPESFPRLVSNAVFAKDGEGDDEVEYLLGNEHTTKSATEKYSVTVTDSDGNEKQETRSRDVAVNDVKKFVKKTDELVFRNLKGETVKASKAKAAIEKLESFLWLSKYATPTKEQAALYNPDLILVSLAEEAE